LGRIGQIDLLPALFTPIYVPEPVMLELDDALTVQGFRLDNDLYQDILSLAGEV
jgi:predicted nucleic acid-binding protein